MNSPTSSREKLLPRLKIALIVGCLSYVAVAGYFVAGTFMANSESRDLRERSRLTQQEVDQLKSQVDRAKALTPAKVPSSLSAITELQSRFHEAAGENGTTLVEFRASTEALPYLTRFSKDTKEKGWNQVEAQASLKGSIRNVMKTLATLGGMEIPFEFNSIEISRDEVNQAGDALVVANVSFRVLTRGGESG